MTRERPTCRECACTKVCEYFENENGKNLDEVCPLCNWEKYFVPKREWISVEDRLPENEQMVLTIDTVGEMQVCFYETAWEGIFQQFHGLVKIYNITHWMPLPEPPETKGETE